VHIDMQQNAYENDENTYRIIMNSTDINFYDEYLWSMVIRWLGIVDSMNRNVVDVA
jgi:hypothetical protein